MFCFVFPLIFKGKKPPKFCYSFGVSESFKPNPDRNEFKIMFYSCQGEENQCSANLGQNKFYSTAMGKKKKKKHYQGNN